jgi:hypothetical protein
MPKIGNYSVDIGLELGRLKKKPHNPYHDNDTGCWECLRETEYNKAIDDVIEYLQSNDREPTGQESEKHTDGNGLVRDGD